MSDKIVGMERGSVRFHHIGRRPNRTEFWLTPLNRIIIVTPAGSIVFPKLRGSTIIYGDSDYDQEDYVPTPEVEAWLKPVLQKQREIRSGWRANEEDDTAFDNYN